MISERQETIPAGWVTGDFDGHVGTRIYPSWRGALGGKRLVCRDIRVMDGEYFVHSPWKNEVQVTLGRDIRDVEAYIERHGVVVEEGANVWD